MPESVFVGLNAPRQIEPPKPIEEPTVNLTAIRTCIGLAEYAVETRQLADLPTADDRRAIEQARRSLEVYEAGHPTGDRIIEHGVDIDAAMIRVRAADGVEVRVATFVTHMAAYKHRTKWTGIGFAARTQKLGETEYAVFAAWKTSRQEAAA